LLSNECQFAFHDTCLVPEWCDCICHLVIDEDGWDTERLNDFDGGAES
jgi:hypothetical protein